MVIVVDTIMFFILVVVFVIIVMVLVVVVLVVDFAYSETARNDCFDLWKKSYWEAHSGSRDLVYVTPGNEKPIETKGIAEE